MRLLCSDDPHLIAGSEADPQLLATLYAFPADGAVRSNFVATLDGATTGGDGRSGSINNAPDKVVFDVNRALADVVVVGQATVDAEAYEPTASGKPLLAVSNRCLVPGGWAAGPREPGDAVLVTVQDADPARLDAARELLGDEHVWTLGTGHVDLARLIERVRELGHRAILCEGGPRLHTEMVRIGLIDQVALTWVPTLVGGAGTRLALGVDLSLTVRLRHLLEADGTLLGLWER